MRYTFLMPAYKGRFIREAIDSILAQTYKDFTLIVSDDCSPENLREIVAEYNDPRLLYRCNEQNIGGKDLVAHWNLLLSLAESDYVILAPDDDYYEPNFLEEIDKLAIKYPQVDVLKCRSQKVDENGELLAKDMIYEEVISQLDNAYFQTLSNFVSGIGNYVFSTKALRAMGGFAQYPMAWWSDVMTHLKLSKNGMAVTRDVLFNFRMSDENISSKENSKEDLRQKTEATLKFYKEVKEILASTKEGSKFHEFQKKQWDEYISTWVMNSLINTAKCYTLKECFDVMKKYGFIFPSGYYKYLFIRFYLLKS